jgi:adenylate cyclase
VLVITAQPGHKLHALKAGAKDFVSKPFDVAEVLTRVRNMLEVRLLHVELRRKNAELKVLFDQVVAERKRSERLALQLAPGSIAVRLPTRPDATDETVADVTVLIADLVGFAEVIPSLDHAVMTSCLEELFAGFDALTTARGVRTVKVLGNSYMAAAGVPFAMSDHAVQAALLARDMMEALEQFNERTGCTLQLRIGLASGTAFAAVLGKRRFLYDLWGGAVAIAERMESHGVAGRVQLSQGTRELLDESVDVEPRGMLEVEGLGEVQTWFLR